MTEKQKQLLSDIECYNVLAKAMLEKISGDRADAIEFALSKQNELLCDLLESVSEEGDKK